ncbi:MAG: tRNA uridine-5-carboxymethylaminomethyl(34) synthesis GTPase MnmE [Rhodobacteraceae bacterium]|nr:tRNA uridine-5-carboxymethylaminomethyl(34) synthesis GTPase MnmE [Paracoccaceae bacterium]MYF47277.1 tRNA uridine-5-carboxymethylaminomethyl(34) synthesis GTPase MnmE [Paracoccaceae bacterium]MYI90804.1 tRNA uridine-5-carboxymethylaminomethyl(34) synthesis GTPase MnmE [Paracoccaceae bacterium]
MFSGLSKETIFAPATAKGKSAVAIIRISGAKTTPVLINLIGSVPQERVLSLRRLNRPQTGEFLDQAMVVFFPNGQSYTGEEAAELHIHGGRATLNAVVNCLLEEGLRMAEPGEFTLRALQNGKMDLAQVEGLGDLIEAETEAQRKQAHLAHDGIVSKASSGWKKDLTYCLALLETEIEFSEEDLPPNVKKQARNVILHLQETLQKEVGGVDMAERLREGFEVAIIGQPNSGKSTLLNYLAGRDAAITSNFAGTTRDVLEVYMDLEGLPVCFLDTAGIRDSSDPVEKIGIERTKTRARDADMRIFLLEEDRQTFPEIEYREGDLELQAKADLIKEIQSRGISGLTGQGVDLMLQDISRVLENRIAKVGVATNARHRQAINQSLEHLAKAYSELGRENCRDEIVAEDLRQAIRALETITGTIDIEQVLGEIFANFCIGK